MLSKYTMNNSLKPHCLSSIIHKILKDIDCSHAWINQHPFISVHVMHNNTFAFCVNNLQGISILNKCVLASEN